MQSAIAILVRIASYEKNEAEIAGVLAKQLNANGFTVQIADVVPGRQNVFAIKNAEASDKSILFYGHMDTVSPVAGWQNPLKPRIEGNRLIGLGAYDMKGGLAAFLEATKNTSAYVKIFLACDEELDSLGAWYAMENNRDFFTDVELVISAEPNFGHGLHGITNGRTGRCLYKVVAEGKAAHIARQNEGVDAIALLSTYLSILYSRRSELSDSYLQAYKVVGASVGMSVCARAEAEIEALVGLQSSKDKVLQFLQMLAAEARVAVEFRPRATPYLDSYYFPEFPHQQELSEVIISSTGKAMKLVQRQSVGDDNVLATLGLPVITWGPDGGGAHEANEWVDIESVKKLSVMYAQFLQKIAKKD